MIVILVWREASMKSGMEGGVMGAFQGLIVFGTYLVFFEWTKSLDPDSLKDATNKPAPTAGEHKKPDRKQDSASDTVVLWTLGFVIVGFVIWWAG